VEVARGSVEVARGSVEAAAGAVEAGQEAVEAAREAVEVAREAVEVAREAVEVARETVEVARAAIHRDPARLGGMRRFLSLSATQPDSWRIIPLGHPSEPAAWNPVVEVNTFGDTLLA
jgi:hypothetical protein